MNVERDNHFVCEAGHPLYRYFLGRTRGHMLLCKSCDVAEIRDLRVEENLIERCVQHLLASNEPPTTVPARPPLAKYAVADGRRALIACGAATDTADYLAIVVADEANARERMCNVTKTSDT